MYTIRYGHYQTGEDHWQHEEITVENLPQEGKSVKRDIAICEQILAPLHPGRKLQIDFILDHNAPYRLLDKNGRLVDSRHDADTLADAMWEESWDWLDKYDASYWEGFTVLADDQRLPADVWLESAE